MSHWGYTPEKCDGDFCPQECDDCPKADMDEEEASKFAWPEDRDIEMGFDPYLGCYTDDC